MSTTVTSKPKPAAEKIPVYGHRVSCNGGGGALGHPKVWYEMGQGQEVQCLYCGAIFVQVDAPEGEDH